MKYKTAAALGENGVVSLMDSGANPLTSTKIMNKPYLKQIRFF